MEKKYPLFDIYWDDDDLEMVSNVIKRGSYWAIGPEIREFEQKLGEYLNTKFVVTFNSGTSALHSVLLAYGIVSGDVIVPSFSFISTANCVMLAGAKPVFAEIEEETLGLDLEDVKEKITDNTKAIIPMHYGGKVSKNLIGLREIAEDYKLTFIEDNAESLGAKLGDKLAGTFGHAGMFSFCQNKIITTGEGGAICTDDENIYKKLTLIRSHGRVDVPNQNYFSTIKEMEYVQIGYNYRMPSICAALGISQLNKIDKIIELRRERGKYYDKELELIPSIQTIPELEGSRTVYQLYSLFLKESEVRENLQNYLLTNGIYTKVYFYPIHLKTFYKTEFGYREGDLPITEEISNKILTLPISLKFSKEDQDHIIKTIEDYFQ